MAQLNHLAFEEGLPRTYENRSSFTVSFFTIGVAFESRFFAPCMGQWEVIADCSYQQLNANFNLQAELPESTALFNLKASSY